jgi:hypothetical protein
MNPDILGPLAGNRVLVNPYDPSMGYVEEGEEPPHDPFEEEAAQVVVPAVLDLATLRRARRDRAAAAANQDFVKRSSTGTVGGAAELESEQSRR